MEVAVHDAAAPGNHYVVIYSQVESAMNLGIVANLDAFADAQGGRLLWRAFAAEFAIGPEPTSGTDGNLPMLAVDRELAALGKQGWAREITRTGQQAAQVVEVFDDHEPQARKRPKRRQA